MIDNPLCLLVLEERPNSFLPIDIKLLDIGASSASIPLKDLDHLIFINSEEFIREKIKTNNIVPEYALNGELAILYEDENRKKRKLPIIPEECYFHGNLREVLFNNIENKKIINNIINKINILYIEDVLKEQLINLIKNGYVEEFCKVYYKLPYFAQRILLLQISNLNDLQNKRVREKNEVE